MSYRSGALNDVPALLVSRLEPEPLPGALVLAELPLQLLLVRVSLTLLNEGAAAWKGKLG